MKKRITRVTVSIFLSLAVLLSGTGVEPTGAVSTAKTSKTAKVSLAKKNLSLTILQNAEKVTKGTAKIKVKKKKGVKIKKITYLSLEKRIAKVNQSGKVTAEKMGATKIVVSVKYRFKKKTVTKNLTCKISVKNTYKNIFSGIRFKQKNYATYVGGADGVCPCYQTDVSNLNPDFYAWDCLKMEIADTSVIEQGVNGFILGLKPGTTTVTIRSTDGSKLTDTATVRVYAKVEDVPPQEDLYTSEKNELIEAIESKWTEEDRNRYLDKDGHFIWDYFEQAEVQYLYNKDKLIDDYRAVKTKSYPDGSAEDTLLSLLSTEEAMKDNVNGDALFFEALEKKLVTPIMNATSLAELREVLAELNFEGVSSIFNTSGIDYEMDNEEVYEQLFYGESTADLEEPLSLACHYHTRLSATRMDALTKLKSTAGIKTYVGKVLGFVGIKDKTVLSKTKKFVLDMIETNKEIDPYYNFLKLDALDKKYPNIHVREWLDKLQYNINGESQISLDGTAAVKELNKAFASEKNLDMLKGYAVFAAIMPIALYTKDGVRATMELLKPDDIKRNSESEIRKEVTKQYAENLKGICDMIPWDVDQVYTGRYYSKNYKKQFDQMVDRYADTYREVFRESDRSEKTKTALLKKIDNMTFCNLYPTDDEYDLLTVQDDMKTASEGGTFADCLFTIYKYHAHLSRLLAENDPLKITKWLYPDDGLFGGWNSWDNNAYHTYSINSCIFCHVNMAPIFKDNPTGDEKVDVENIAYMSTTIGHEVGHAFDGTGCYVDENGMFKKCWDDSDIEKHKERLKKLAELYDTYPQFFLYNDKMVLYQHGKKVADEAVADLGGTEIALRLLKKTYPGNDEYIREFFIITAKQWAATYLDYLTIERAEKWVREDTHPQLRSRTNGVASCMEEFYRVFDVKETDAMYIAPEDRVQMWGA